MPSLAWSLDMALSRSELNLATGQGGVVTRAQLFELGRTDGWIERELASGRLTLIKNGVYRLLEMRHHLDLLRAAIVTLPEPVVSHQSAAHLLRFPVLPAMVPTVTVAPHTTHRFPGVVVRRNSDLAPQHLIRLEGLRVTNILRTVFDLSGVLDEIELNALVDGLVAADRLNIPSLDQLAGSLRRRGKPGSVAIGATLARYTGSSMPPSALEELGLQVLRGGGIAEPILEYPAPWNPRKRIDVAWPTAQAGVEWDSASWHSSKQQLVNDRQRDRQAVLAGWVILRYTWHDLTEDPQRVQDEVRRLLSSRS